MTDRRRLSERHPELFHYTSEAGLFAILETQYLRATHWRHLNDVAELLHFYDALPRLILPELLERANEIASRNDEARQWLSGQGGADAYCTAQAQDLAKAFYATLQHPDPSEDLFDFYVTSFCTPDGLYAEVRNHGLLSQWRYYGRDGGSALVFDSVELERLMEREHSSWACRLSCGEVGYSSDSPEILAERIDSLSDFVEAFKGCRFDSEAECEPLIEPLLDCCIHYKHWAFAEEREVRLVAVINSARMREEHEAAGSAVNEREQHYFSRDGQQVPCIHLFDGIKVDRAGRLPIRRIIVGPGPTQPQREARLKEFLQRSGYDIEVVCSSIPIRF